MDALLILARVANVDLTWLIIRGKGEMRPLVGLQPGALVKDSLIVDQYDLVMQPYPWEMVICQIPFSRNFLESKLRLNEPTANTLLAVEAGWNLSRIVRGDLVLIDRKQATLARDGIYLLDFRGLELACDLQASRREGRRDSSGARRDPVRKRASPRRDTNAGFAGDADR